MNKNPFKDENGAALVLVALMLTMLFGFVALAVDVGRINAKKVSIQSAVDAAALAAVQCLPENPSTAAIKADNYFEYNGFEFQYYKENYDLDPEDIIKKEFLNSDKKIRVTASLPLDYTFAKVFNIGDSTTVTKKAAAEVTTPVDDLDYAIFSGSELDMLQFTGSNTEVYGDVHANQNIKGQAYIDGEATASGEFKNPLPTVTGEAIDGSPILEMPILSDDELAELRQSADDSGTLYNGDQVFSPEQLNVIFGSGNVLYVENGGVTINGSGVDAPAGTIIVEGSITFNGSQVEIGSPSPICLYSIGGDITMNGEGAEFCGAIWAPEGTVTFNGQGSDIIGKVYGNIVDINGAITVNYRTDDFPNFLIKKYKLVE